MLIVADSLRQIRFGELMAVYSQSNDRVANHESSRILSAEQDFFAYLQDCFFKIPGARYAIWSEDNHYVSALRLEPYKDGLLLEALETIPEKRNQGFAAQLITAVLNELGKDSLVKIYSHVNKNNTPSLRTHFKCGFRILMDHAVYVDGSADRKAYTLLCENKPKKVNFGD